MAQQARQFMGVVTVGGLLVTSLVLLPLSQTAMRESPEKAASYLPKTTITKRKRLVIDVAAFKKDGIVIVENVLSTEELCSARADVKNMMEANVHFEKTDQDRCP